MSDPKDPNEPTPPEEPIVPPPPEPSQEPVVPPPPEPSEEASRIERDPAFSPAGAMGADALSGGAHDHERTIGAGAPDTAFAAGAAASGDKTMAVVIYVLYLAGVFGGLSAVAGVILAYMSKAEAPEWLRTHYLFQIRTFWIGLAVSAVGVLTSPLVIGIVLIFGAFVWVAIRSAVGLNWLIKGQAYPNYRTWMV